MADTPSRSYNLAASLLAITAATVAGAMGGSLFLGGQTVTDTVQNPYPSQIASTFPYQTYFSTTCTATGGLAAYDTCLLQNPYNSSASSYGLTTGTGVVRYLQFDLIANPSAGKIDCTKVSAAGSATGGTLLVTDASATGAVATYTTAFTMTPTDSIKCGSLTNPTASFSAKLWGIIGASNVIN